MDSEHRHELNENVLAKGISRVWENYGQHATVGIIACVAVVAGLVSMNVYKQSDKAIRSAAWSGYQIAMEDARPNLAVLSQTAEEYPGEPVADWSSITWADGKLWTASTTWLRNRASAEEALATAEETYERLTGSGDDVVANRALLGLARVNELRGDLDQASDYYGKVRGAFADMAAERAEQLAKPSVQSSYAWLSGVETPGAAIDELGPGTTDAKPDDLAMPEETIDPDAALQGIYDSYDEERSAAPAGETEQETAAEEAAGESEATEPAAEEEAASEATEESDAPAAELPF
ncbi:hypothetical protein Mal64_10360 [Pseudobythopirellula maris]|uniref:Tetratricopeptide repeat-like domain-containing protein n=1 Tax=Pseudobythopirellula maris TaxID=2527991 RepID=A0A5C5ZSX3_9BACT|nr:hypothetical protein [Pseudobythopirellula maris]TWT90642.1 hypothetical protein Mal64_10360 [Pseudobythopirellula maris]